MAVLDRVLSADGFLSALYNDVIEEQKFANRQRPLPDPQALPPVRDPGDRSDWVRDVTIPDGTLMAPGQLFVKTWRVRNAGTVVWENRFLKRTGVLGAAGQVSTARLSPVRRTEPGQEVDISVSCKAHVLPGSSVAHFKMSDASGQLYFPRSYPAGLVLAITVDESQSTGRVS